MGYLFWRGVRIALPAAALSWAVIIYLVFFH